MRRVTATELRRFVLERLGLAGPLPPADRAAALAADLAMIQIDSIRVTGLRNHELAWLARSEANVAEFYAMLYRTLTEGAPLEITPQHVRQQIAVIEEAQCQNPHIYPGHAV